MEGTKEGWKGGREGERGQEVWGREGRTLGFSFSDENLEFILSPNLLKLSSQLGFI